MKRQLLTESIRIDGETQSRERINEETVAEYTEAMKGATAMPWPPVMVYFDGTDYWMADGFHRLLAAVRAGKKNIMAEVKQGSRADAAWAACAANQAHGLRRTNADKRKAVEMALKLRPQTSASMIADHCGVGDDLVQTVRDSLGIPKPGRVTGKDGKQYAVPISLRFTKPDGAGATAGSEASETPHHAAPTRFGPPPSPAERRAAPVEPFDTAQGRSGGPPPPSSPPSTSAARRRDYPVDDMGRRIPERLLSLWARRQEAQDLATALSRVRATLDRAQEGHDPLYSEISFSGALAHLDQAYALVQVAKPYAVCPLCQGHGCQLCRERGLIGKFRWDTAVPREVKEAVARLIEKEQAAGEESAA